MEHEAQTALATRSHGKSLQEIQGWRKTGPCFTGNQDTPRGINYSKRYCEYYAFDTQTLSAANVPRRIWCLSIDSETVPS